VVAGGESQDGLKVVAVDEGQQRPPHGAHVLMCLVLIQSSCSSSTMEGRLSDLGGGGGANLGPGRVGAPGQRVGMGRMGGGGGLTSSKPSSVYFAADKEIHRRQGEPRTGWARGSCDRKNQGDERKEAGYFDVRKDQLGFFTYYGL
jgi:hypothetical protein